MTAMLEELPRFACDLDKKPLTPNGFYNAVVRADHSGWPRVGVRTGRLSGIDVVDVDPDGCHGLRRTGAGCRLPESTRARGAAIFSSAMRRG
jgi:hypothetical protein